MTQAERRIYLIKELLAECSEYDGVTIPRNEEECKKMLRTLFNVRLPKPVSDKFLKIQDEYLQTELLEKGITDISDLKPIYEGIYIWQGDITTLRCDAIVNAANSGMTGCYQPLHTCIDNCIHTFAGVQLRLACHDMMKKQGFAEPVGKAKITPSFNLPCKYVLHTVGPVAEIPLTEKDKKLLASCYRSCLELADENGIKNIAFCCISTGVFHFPNDKAAEIAIQSVKEYRERKKSSIEVIFNVYKDIDYKIYKKFLEKNNRA